MQNLVFDDEMSGHDSQIESVLTDPVAQTDTVSLLAYPTTDSRHRIPIKIVSSKVTSVSTILDMKELANNRGEGNMTQWHIARKAGTSFIQLTGGCLAITSRIAPTLIGGAE